MGDGGFGAKIMFTISEEIPIIGGVPITETITTTWIIMAILIIGSIILTRNLKRIPGGVQNIVETVVGTVYNLTESTMGKDKVSFAPYIGTLMMYLAVANLVGLLGIRPPTADLNMTLSLALMTFFMIHFNGIRRKGILGYLKGFTEPFFLLTPINIIGEIATPISLSFRLFGNMVGGTIIMALVYSALAALTTALFGMNIPIFQLGIPAVLHVYFDVFSGLLQTFIFAMLTMVFVSGAMD
ncbi:F0F1 ATP synthase subunit A [Proteocatella sphenisci]|uniref:F0F1 ATP synthase subunit A n=1 Tax=Proteocatella sphenisci TaxID=181070 RepID=UPI000491E61B|nr:F0F1 ATP synthase subunit A [Proteocatella sphenisci]